MLNTNLIDTKDGTDWFCNRKCTLSQSVPFVASISVECKVLKHLHKMPQFGIDLLSLSLQHCLTPNSASVGVAFQALQHNAI